MGPQEHLKDWSNFFLNSNVMCIGPECQDHAPRPECEVVRIAGDGPQLVRPVAGDRFASRSPRKSYAQATNGVRRDQISEKNAGNNGSRSERTNSVIFDS